MGRRKPTACQRLGEKLIVGGLSMGGAVTAWLAQIHPEIDLAVIIAPAIAYRAFHLFCSLWRIPIISWLPDRMRWWDRKLKEKIEGADYNYAWVSMHGLAIFPRMGCEVRKLNRKTPPAAKEIWMVINDHDAACGWCLCPEGREGMAGKQNREQFIFIISRMNWGLFTIASSGATEAKSGYRLPGS